GRSRATSSTRPTALRRLPNRPQAPLRPEFDRCLLRYIDSIHHLGHVGAGGARVALGPAAPWLRPEEAPLGTPRPALGDLVRLALPGAAPPGAGGSHRRGRRERGPDHDDRRLRADRIPQG